MFTDTHCHLLKEDYSDLEEIINNLNKNNLKRIIINGYNDQTNREVVELVNKYPNIYGALGFHPDNIDEISEDSIDFIKQHLDNPKILAIGEIGLDYFHNKENKIIQKEIFNLMLKIAEDFNKPVIIHNREATDDLLRILKQYKIKGIIHCFSGSYETAIEYIKLGFKMGINGILTFKNSNLKEVLSKLSVEHFLLETDAPYITPEPIRKEKNQPAYIIYPARKMMEIYSLSEEDLAEKLEENLRAVFDI